MTDAERRAKLYHVNGALNDIRKRLGVQIGIIKSLTPKGDLHARGLSICYDDIKRLQDSLWRTYST